MNYTPINFTPINEKDFKISSTSSNIRLPRSNFIFASFIGVLIIFSFFISSLFVLAYTNFKLPFFSNSLSQRIKVYFAFLPLFPKTKEQIILASAYKASKVKSFDMGFSGALTINYSGIDFNLDLQGKSKLDFWDNLKSETELEGKVSGAFGEYSGDFRTIYSDGETYLKFDYLPDKLFSYLKNSMREYGVNFSDDFFDKFKNILTSKWIKGEASSRTSARRELQKKQEESTKRFYQNLRELVLNINLMNKTSLFKKKDFYVFYTTYSGREIMREVQKAILKSGKVFTENDGKVMDKFFQGIKELKVTVEVGKKDYLIKKISFLFKGNFNPKTFSYQAGGVLSEILTSSLDIGAASTFSFSNINERKIIEEPVDFITINELYEQIQKELVRGSSKKGFNTSYLPSSQIKATAKDLVLKIEEYRKINGSYPRDINELILYFPDTNLAKQLQKYNIYYVTSSDKKSFLVYAPYRVGEKGVEYIVYSGVNKNEVLVASELQERVNILKKDVLGAFIKRIVKP